MLKLVFSFTLFLLLIAQPGQCQDWLDQEMETLKTHARVDWEKVSPPINRLLLVKDDKSVCAIKFTELHRGNDAKAPTVFNSGDETVAAKYQWYCQTNESNSFKMNKMTDGVGSLVSKPLKGIGRLAFQTGNVVINCGPFDLYWDFPSFVSFSSTPDCSNSKVMLSPTRWLTIDEVDVKSTNLKWYVCDEKRKKLYISIDEL